MNWHQLTNDEHLRLWKELRLALVGLPLIEQLTRVANFCAPIPYGSRSVDYYSPLEWPTPWEIIYFNSFCTSSISLLAFYTLCLLTDDINVELHLIDDGDEIFMIPVVDNQYVVNYYPNEISMYPDIEKDFKVLQIYTKSQVKKIT
jgi:hypothetical protein